MKKLILWCLSLFLTFGVALPPAPVQAQTDNNNDNDAKPTRVQGRILKSYREDDAAKAATPQTGAAASTATRKQRPLWVESALQRSFDFLGKQDNVTSATDVANAQASPRQRDVKSDFALVSAEQDDLGQTHVRLNQFRNGLRVFGAQVITHLDAKTMRAVSGRNYDELSVETTSDLTSAQASPPPKPR